MRLTLCIAKKQILLLVLCLWTTRVTCEKGSCRASRKCCDGKNPDCLVDQDYSNDIDNEYQDYSNEEIEPCYCDHGCLDLGDCCPDFKDYCGVIDCKVRDWGDWSKCDQTCGTGTSRRSRSVLRPASNGGEKCPHLEERQPCHNPKCARQEKSFNGNSASSVSAYRETAMLLPGKYAKQNLNAKKQKTYDVRENLKTYKNFEYSEEDQYCVVFQVNKALRGCEADPETEKLIRGNTVCVMCDSKAQRSYLGGRCTGHGAEGKRTRFKTVLSSKCHGKWTRLEVKKQCPCENGPDFTLV